ncbi:MAG: hypothetical protein JNK35_13950, partial [Phycisphaerae bacterium]|nr:hypothetical protein [Phycisphaerae bacterium]
MNPTRRSVKRGMSSGGGPARAALALLAGTACALWAVPAVARAQDAPKPAEAPAAAEKPATEEKPAAAQPEESSSRRRRGGGEAAAAGGGGGGGGDAAKPAGEPMVPVKVDEIVGWDDPLGFAGESLTVPRRVFRPEPMLASPDRWRIGWPSWDRYNKATPGDAGLLMSSNRGDGAYTEGSIWNPYDRNVLKGDYPIIGNDIFLLVQATSDTLYLNRKNITPSGNAAQLNDSFDQFKDGRGSFINQNFFLTIEISKGYTAFRPIDWAIKVTPVTNINYLNIRENATDIDPLKGNERYDTFTTLQEAVAEIHLGDLSEYFDILSLRVGRQLFNSDFRGFIFNDISDGVRLSGNAMANRLLYNVAFFNSPEKDTNSGLNELNWRQQQVLIANAYLQDFIWLGYTIQGSFHWNHDTSDDRYDSNGFPVRPDLAGDVLLRDLDAYYVGFASDGHIGRLNVSHAVYYAFGEDEHNPIAGRRVDISAYMAALELSVDFDWLRPKVSFLYASGDSDPTDDTGGGFDAIFDDPTFAGGPSSFYQNQSVRLFGVGLNQGRSFFNTLKSSKLEGQSN